MVRTTTSYTKENRSLDTNLNKQEKGFSRVEKLQQSGIKEVYELQWLTYRLFLEGLVRTKVVKVWDLDEKVSQI